MMRRSIQSLVQHIIPLISFINTRNRQPLPTSYYLRDLLAPIFHLPFIPALPSPPSSKIYHTYQTYHTRDLLITTLLLSLPPSGRPTRMSEPSTMGYQGRAVGREPSIRYKWIYRYAIANLSSLLTFLR